MDNSDQHGKYGDTPLGKSDEELRQEGADAQTNSERRHHQTPGEEEEVGVIVPVAGVGGSSAAVAPGLLSGEPDREEEDERQHE